MKRSHTIHKENCTPSVRDVLKIADTLYMLLGTYAYEWKIMTKTNDGLCVVEYKSCKEARKEWKKKQKLASSQK